MRIALLVTAVMMRIELGYEATIACANSSTSATQTESLREQQDAGVPGGDQRVKIQVVSKSDNSPLAGATVWVRALGGRTRTWEGTTDGLGKYEMILPGRATSQLEIVVAHEAYLMSTAVYLMSTGVGGPKPEYTIPLEQSRTIGGIVRDEAGRPIQGARVLASYLEPDVIWPEVYESPESALAIGTTDAQGRWRADALPERAELNTVLIVRTIHPDHIAARLVTSAGKGLTFSIEQVMKTGVSVSGTVLSPLGRPVPGATVVVTVPPSERMFLRLTTDKKGQFHSGRCFDPIRTKPLMTVLASGLAMAAQDIVAGPDAPALVIRLSRRRPIEGQVIDARGRPVAGAAVSPAHSFFKGMLDWDAETGPDGRFIWHDAPVTDALVLDVSKPNYRPIRERAVDRDADELVITLRHPQRLRGKVTDAVTGRPIEGFTLIHGSGPSLPDMRPVWNLDHKASGAKGAFNLDYGTGPDDNSRRSIRIEADGYEPVEFLGFPSDAEEVVHDFKLHKATPFSGSVRGPDGQLLDEANVALADLGSMIPLYYYWTSSPLSIFTFVRTATEGGGRYSFPYRDRNAWGVASHKAGFAIRSPEQLAASSEIKLAPWGRIEGVVKIGNKIASSQRVAARLRAPQFHAIVEHTTRTDHDGRFKFDFVAPGALTIGRQVSDVRPGTYMLSNVLDVEVAPGQTTHVVIGGQGRPLTGRFILPQGTGALDLSRSQARLRSLPPVLRRPDGFIDFTDEQWSAWWKGFHASPEGRAFVEGERQFAVSVNPDGTFRVEDVPAGRYILKLTYRRIIGDGSLGRVVIARREVTVPEIPGGRTDGPLDIGAIPVESFPMRKLDMGQRVPDVIVSTGPGGNLDLASMRGKVVLLAFWSTRWSMADLASLKATHDAFARDARFVMIGLNEDFAPEAMKWCVTRHHLSWEQRYLGKSDDPNPIAAAFGVQCLSTVFLIGPDGRVIARDLDAAGIKDAVAAALSQLVAAAGDDTDASVASGEKQSGGGTRPNDSHELKSSTFPVPGEGKPPEAIAFDATGARLLAILPGGELRMVDVAGGHQKASGAGLRRKWLSPAMHATFSADGSLLATVVGPEAGTIQLWTVPDGNNPGAFSPIRTLAETPNAIYQLAMSHDGERLASAEIGASGAKRYRRIVLWETAFGRPVIRIPDQPTPAHNQRQYGGLALSPDGTLLAFDDYPSAASGSGPETDPSSRPSIHLFDVSAGRDRAILRGHESVIVAAAFSRDGRTLATADRGRKIIVWNVAAGKPLHERPLEGDTFQLAFSPDGTRLGGVNHQEINLWDVLTGREALRLRRAPIRSGDASFNPQIAWSRDGRRFAASNFDCSLTIWEGE